MIVQSHGLIGKLKLRLLREKKNQGFLFTGFVPTSWALCCKTWLKFEIKFAIVGDKKNDCLLRRKKMMKEIFFPKYFWGGGLCLTHVWAPCCE